MVLRLKIALILFVGVSLVAAELGRPQLLFQGSGRVIGSKPRGNAVMYADGAGLLFDATSNNIGGYWPFGPTNLVNLTMEAIITPLSTYTGASYASYPSNTYGHGGVGVRDVASSDFAMLVMLAAENTNGVPGAGQIHIVDRTNSAEYLTKYDVVGISYGTRYKLKLVNSQITNLAVTLWNYDAGILLTNFNYSVQPGYPTSGCPVFHVYAQRMLINQALVTEQDGTRTWYQPTMISQNYQANNQQGYYLSNGVLRMFSNGSSNSANSWNLATTQLRIGATGTVTGKLRPISGRIHGIHVGYSNGLGSSLAWDDNNNGIRHYTNLANSSAAIVTTYATGDLTFGTEYPWTLSKRGDVLAWTIDGDTVTITNTTYPGADFLGLVGFGSLTEHRDIFVGP